MQFEDMQRELNEHVTFAHEMVGESRPMQRVYEVLRKCAASDATVLILGENGTGKELAARAIHRNSRRAGKPLVAVNCATLKEALLESDLFGHERGAFTGAVAQKKGKFELADGGTIFLDEIAELDAAVQARLLRVLQEREFERVGGTRTLQVDVRVIAATNRELAREVAEGKFRRDLYFRLNVLSVTMPPLRERRDDIPLLADHFIERFAREAGRRVRGISEGALAAMLRHDWPGNIRELQNAIERAVALGSSEEIAVEDLPETVLECPVEGEGAADAPPFYRNVQEAKRRQIVEEIARAGGNISEAARALGLTPNYLHRLVTRMGLRNTVRSSGA